MMRQFLDAIAEAAAKIVRVVVGLAKALVEFCGPVAEALVVILETPNGVPEPVPLTCGELAMSLGGDSCGSLDKIRFTSEGGWSHSRN